MRNLINNNNFGIIQIIGFMVLSIGIPFLFFFFDLMLNGELNGEDYFAFLIPLIIIACGVGLVLQRNWGRILLLIFWILIVVAVLTDISFSYINYESVLLILGVIGISLGFLALLFNQKINEEIKDKSKDTLYDDILDVE